MPLIPTIPHINTKKRLLFSLAGVMKDREIAIIVPIRIAQIFAAFHFSIRLATK